MAIYAVHQHDPKFIFVVNYKVMYSTLDKILPRYFPNVQFIYKKNIIDLNFDDFIQIAIVRNPYMRTISTYRDKCLNAPKAFINHENAQLQFCQAQILEALSLIRNTSFQIATPAKHYNSVENPKERKILNDNFELLQSISFEEYIICLLTIISRKDADRHFQPQINAFKIQGKNPFFNRNKVVNETRIFKLENIDSDWTTVCTLLDKEIILQKVNSSNNDHTPLKEIYTTETQNLIAKLYKRDFQKFNYSLEL